MRNAIRHGVRTLALGGWRELADVAAAQRALVAAQLLVWRRPVGQLLESMPKSAASDPHVPIHERIEAARIAVAQSRAARHGVFRPRCLVRALALHRALEARGIRGSIVRIGVRQQGADLLAHAWVEHRGVVLGDTTALTSAFSVLTDAHLATAVAERA